MFVLKYTFRWLSKASACTRAIPCLFSCFFRLYTKRYFILSIFKPNVLFLVEKLQTDVGELIGETTIEKAGLLSPDLFKVYPHFVNAYDSVYKIADNVTDWYRAPIAVLCNDSADTCMDFLSFIYIPDTGLAASLKRILKKPLQVKYYIKGRDLFVSFTFNNELPNHAYILSPHGIQLVGTPDIIDDSFTEITEKL